MYMHTICTMYMLCVHKVTHADEYISRIILDDKGLFQRLHINNYIFNISLHVRNSSQLEAKQLVLLLSFKREQYCGGCCLGLNTCVCVCVCVCARGDVCVRV